MKSQISRSIAIKCRAFVQEQVAQGTPICLNLAVRSKSTQKLSGYQLVGHLRSRNEFREGIGAMSCNDFRNLPVPRSLGHSVQCSSSTTSSQRKCRLQAEVESSGRSIEWTLWTEDKTPVVHDRMSIYDNYIIKWNHPSSWINIPPILQHTFSML